MSAYAMDRSESAPACAAASSSATPLQPRRAVMLKGPSLTSKTFFVPLPNTLDELIAKAVQLFPIPPGKVPQITLGADERAIILDESYEFIRDREILNFRWSAETPRRNLGNRVRWNRASSSTSTTPFSLTASPQGTAASSDEVAPTSSVTKAADALKAQLQGSPTSKNDVASKTRANTIANRDPNTQLGEGVAARKAHAKRVLAEQQRKLEEEHEADALGAAPIIPDADQEIVVDADPEATAQAVLELASTSEAANTVEGTGVAEKDVAAIAQGMEMSTVEQTAHQTQTLSSMADAAPEIVLAPVSEAITINSPPRKKHVDNGGLDTPPSSGSRSNSPFHSSDTLDHRMRAEADDEPSSSPMSSPTRDVSSRYRNALPAMPMHELGKIASAEPVEAAPEEMLVDALPADGTIASDAVNSDLPADSATTNDETAVAVAQDPNTAPATPATKTSANQANDRELNRIYSFLSNLISQLLSHKSNWAFQRPIGVEFEQFSARSSRPVDLFTIRDSLTARRYGSQHLEGRMAANAVVTEFEDDLNLLYANARRFFGVRSTQAECVEHLEKFSRSFLNEWKRSPGSAAQGKAGGDATARLAAQRSPGSRGEKHAFMSSSPFAALLTPGSSAAQVGPTSSSGKKTGQPLSNTIGLMRRPDFTFKRNASYEFAKRPAAPTRTTSEAFERALRAATSTPQTDRVKQRPEVVAPFATRSVIETDFMARPPPSQQAESSPTPTVRTPSTPTGVVAGSKRKHVEPPASRSPSVSPPPSPSPTKRVRLPLATLKPSKSRRGRKARQQAAAAAAAAAAALELTESKRAKANKSSDAAEEQHVLQLIEPPAKRTRAARSASVSTDAGSVQLTPGGRTLRSRKAEEIPPPATPSRSGKRGKANVERVNERGVEGTMDTDGFEVTGSRRRSSRQRKPVNLD